MKLNHTPQVVALDQLAGPRPETYAFETVTQRGDLDDQVRFGVPPVIHASMAEVLAELYTAKSHGSLERRYWHPARAVLGVLDCAPRDGAYLSLLTGATRVALEMYADPSYTESLVAFDEDITTLGLRDMLVSHEGDPTTQQAEGPHYSRLAAYDIANDIGAPALFLANCHGGLIPAIQTALTYERTVPGNRLFPIKYSIYKSKSQGPEVTPEELRLITEASEDMPVIVYDDDAGGGHTLRHLVRYLSAQLPAGRNISGYVSLDERSYDTRQRQGEHWEHYLMGGSQPL